MEYAYDVLLRSDNAKSLQFLFGPLINSAIICGICIASSSSKLLLRNWIGPNMDIVLAGEVPGEMDRYGHLGGCITLGDIISEVLLLTQ